jgi:hypothetical protein
MWAFDGPAPGEVARFAPVAWNTDRESMGTDEDDLDRLYQLPLDEFTAARNALAKQPGASVGIKTLHKPSVPAWAVNQLYWRHRKTYDRLIQAAEQLANAHRQMLTGKRADVAAAEAAHAESVKAALEAVRGVLTAGGDPATPSTITAVTETLQALPGDEPPGRLTRPLKPKGFEALAGLFGGAGAALRLVPPPPKSTAKSGAASQPEAGDKRRAEAERKAEAARRRESEAIESDLKAARAQERQAQATLERARTAHRAAEEERAQLTARLDQLIDRLRELSDAVHLAERDASKAVNARERLELRLAALGTSGS